MNGNITQRTYLPPANSQALNTAEALLKTLGLRYEILSATGNSDATLLNFSVSVPTIPVVHHFDLLPLRSDFATQVQSRIDRQSNMLARNWVYGELKDAHAEDFSLMLGRWNLQLLL